jgi:endoglucanase
MSYTKTTQVLRALSLVALCAASFTGCIPKKPKPPGEAAEGSSASASPGARAPLHVEFTEPVKVVSAPILNLKRGINLGNGLDAPREGEWGVTLDEKHFAMAAAAGLDHVRLPVRFNAHAEESAPFTVNDKFFGRVDWAIAEARKNKLAIIVDFHHYEDLMKQPDAHAERFLGIWRQIAERYKNQPESVLFEILNEPNSELDAKRWNQLAARAISAVRETNPGRILIVDSYFWGAAKELKNLELPSDPNVVASFHMYQPILFTHQGAPWMGPEYQTRGIIFPGPPSEPVTPVGAAEDTSWVRDWLDNYNRQPTDRNPSGPGAVAQEFDMATRYVEATGKRVYLGEFGAVDKADPLSRENYLRLVRREAERRGFPWAIWDDGGMNRAMRIQDGTWEEPVAKALFHDQ